MSNVPRLAILIVAVCYPARVTLAADPPKAIVRVEAVVQTYETAAMGDLLADGRFAVDDAVTFRLVAPAEMADTTIRVHLWLGSVADDSPLRRPGQRCHFDFDKNLLKKDQLFRGALENLTWIGKDGVTRVAEPATTMRPVDRNLLAVIEKELARLHEDAKDETGPIFPRPSNQVAYYLLAGLAKQGILLEDLPESEQRVFDVQRRAAVRAKLISVFADVRVALIDYAVQDKAGSYLRRTAVLYVQQDGEWLKKGSGETAAAELPNSDACWNAFGF